MRTRARLLLLLPIAVLISGCGGGSADAPAPSTGTFSAPQITGDPAHLVLDAGDIGNGYLTVASQTGIDTLEQTIVQGSAVDPGDRADVVAVRLPRPLFGRAGRRAHRRVAVSHEPSALRVSRSWQTSELKTFHGRLIAPPAGSLDHVTMIAGSIPVRGHRTKAYFIQWVHGN